ncbi:MAG: sigma-54 dependent transcriptional regulator [Candidatus Aminicenantes bacterium]|jgi:DNA-binding NtrC family response regulator
MKQKRVLIIDDEKLIRWSLIQKLSEWDFETLEAETCDLGRQTLRRESPDLVILDVNLPDQKGTDFLEEIKSQWPDIPVIMITAYGSIDDAVTAMRHGAYDFITKPINDLKLQNAVNNALETASLKREVAYYKEKEQKGFDPSSIIAISNTMKKILEITKIVAQSEATIVLLQGESGTGKDLLAKAIHYLSRRKEASYQAINCSAIPENLLESELFGYEKGAFTDAKQQKKGLVELAHKGTLLLDEIGTMSLALQAKLLRFLETQTFKRVGGLKDIEVDIRVIAATNQDLESATREEKFRNDLFYRLNVCPIYIPPLRERKDDILPLAKFFIKQENIRFRKSIQSLDKEAQKLFLDYDWPGNIRELKNAIERAMIFEEGPFITAKHLPFPLERKPPSYTADLKKQNLGRTITLADAEKDLLIRALKDTHGNKSKAAKRLGITRDTMRYKIKKWNITSKDFNLP